MHRTKKQRSIDSLSSWQFLCLNNSSLRLLGSLVTHQAIFNTFFAPSKLGEVAIRPVIDFPIRKSVVVHSDIRGAHALACRALPLTQLTLHDAVPFDDLLRLHAQTLLKLHNLGFDPRLALLELGQ